MDRDGKRLTLVVNPPGPDEDSEQAEPNLGLAGELEEVLEEQLAIDAEIQPDRAAATDRWSAAYALPATLRQVLEAAKEAETRAGILDGVVASVAQRRANSAVRSATGLARINRRARILDRRAKTIRDAANDLRMIAARLVDESRGQP